MADPKKLARERKRLAAIVPLLDSDRRPLVEERIKRIDAKLGRPKPGVGTLQEQASGIDGVGGLHFQARSVPGQGRLIRIPFLLRAFDVTQGGGPGFPSTAFIPAPPPEFGVPALTPQPLLITAAGNNVAGGNNPTVIATIPTVTGVNVLKGLFYETPVLEWVKYRVVGFQGSATPAPIYNSYPGFLPAVGADYIPSTYYSNPSPVPFLLVKNLTVGGSANLFPQPGFVDAAYYNATLPYFTGLRDYPVVERTNRVLVEAAISGAQASSMTISMWVVGETMTDTFYGNPKPGPYAQEGALKRAPSKTREGFVR